MKSLLIQPLRNAKLITRIPIISFSCLTSNHSLILKGASSVQLCPTLCNPMNCSMPGLPVHHQLLESTQTHIY